MLPLNRYPVRRTPACWLCDATDNIRVMRDARDCFPHIPTEYVCEDCFTPRDTGPCFDDLPQVA